MAETTLMSTDAPSTNGTTTAHPAETCLQRVLRTTKGYDASHWLGVFHYCHIPPHAPAEEWESGIARVVTCGHHIQVVPRGVSL